MAIAVGDGGLDDGSSSNYGKSVDYKYILKEFQISTADGLHLGNEEKNNTEVSQVSLVSGGVSEVLVTEKTSERTDFYWWGRRSRKSQVLLYMFKCVMPTQ